MKLYHSHLETILFNTTTRYSKDYFNSEERACLHSDLLLHISESCFNGGFQPCDIMTENQRIRFLDVS